MRYLSGINKLIFLCLYTQRDEERFYSPAYAMFTHVYSKRDQQIMSNLLSECAEALAWADATMVSLEGRREFGRFNPGVIWTEVTDPKKAIPIIPEKLAEQINTRGQALLLRHDPGKPLGRVLAARVFKAHDGRKFIAAILGIYNPSTQIGFSDFDLDPSIAPDPPSTLPSLGERHWIEIGVDPREVEETWAEVSAEGAPIRVKRRTLSHNAAEATTELIRLTLPYVALVWNPFVTTIATEAGKDAYKALRSWITGFMKRVSELKSPILVIQATLDDSEVSFIVRGNDTDTLLAARETLEGAALQAARLVRVLVQKNAPAQTLFYEFDSDRKIWLPSYAVLQDGRLISDNRALLMTENLPQGLSLGLGDDGTD